MYGYSRTYRTYLAALAGLCFALFSVSSVAQQVPPGQGVSVDLSPTTSHWQTNSSTFRTPPGVTTSPSTAVGPVTRLPNGGAGQPMGSGITITSLERSAPLSSILRTGPAAVRTAAIRCFGNPLCTLSVTGATIGLEQLLNTMNWGIDDEGTPTQTVTDYPDQPPSGSNVYTVNPQTGTALFCQEQSHNYECGVPTADGRYFYYCPKDISIGGGRYSPRIFPRVPGPGLLCTYFTDDSYLDFQVDQPVSMTDISDAVNQNYDFHPSDWPVIGPHIPLESADVEIEITNAPTLITPPKTTTVYDENGQPHTITETNIDYSFTPRPGTNPGPRPAIDLETTETTTTYNPDGTSTGSSTTTTTRPAGDSTPPSDPSMKIEFPGFCEWAPKLCGWLDWTQEGWDAEEPELPQIIDFEPEGDFQVGGAGDCPAPYTINLGWRLNQSIEVSYQPFCDLGSLIKPLFLAFCYLFAGVITVRSL